MPERWPYEVVRAAAEEARRHGDPKLRVAVVYEVARARKERAAFVKSLAAAWAMKSLAKGCQPAARRTLIDVAMDVANDAASRAACYASTVDRYIVLQYGPGEAQNVMVGVATVEALLPREVVHGAALLCREPPGSAEVRELIEVGLAGALETSLEALAGSACELLERRAAAARGERIPRAVPKRRGFDFMAFLGSIERGLMVDRSRAIQQLAWALTRHAMAEYARRNGGKHGDLAAVVGEMAEDAGCTGLFGMRDDWIGLPHGARRRASDIWAAIGLHPDDVITWVPTDEVSRARRVVAVVIEVAKRLSDLVAISGDPDQGTRMHRR